MYHLEPIATPSALTVSDRNAAYSALPAHAHTSTQAPRASAPLNRCPPTICDHIALSASFWRTSRRLTGCYTTASRIAPLAVRRVPQRTQVSARHTTRPALVATNHGRPPSPLYPADAGYMSASAGASMCERCPTNHDSTAGQSSCELCVANYYWDGAICQPCPLGATCSGGDLMPIPDKGFWASYDSVEHAHSIYECHKGTCTGGGDADSKCWATTNYSKCETSELQCSEGATGILCGACKPKFTYNKIVNACVQCTR